MLLFASSVLLSAFLLFLIQPMLAKAILPWFGGTSAVWTTCMVFFQALLPAGYAYSHFLTSRVRPRRQFVTHLSLLAASLLVLPVNPPEWLKPEGSEGATLRILALLGCTVALPYLVLSTTGPLMQRWMARLFPEQQVYRLFAWSNLGSLFGLLVFPFGIERLATSRGQLYGWSVAYGVFVLICGATVLAARRGLLALQPSLAGPDSGAPGASATLGTSPRAWDYATWLALPALGSIVLLATTHHLTQNVAPVPLLWVLPLALYLLTFVAAFEGRGGRGLYDARWVLLPTLLFAVLMAAGLSAMRGALDVGVAVVLNSTGMFLACLFCHGELALRKPEPRYLTHFYLSLAIGGALGGLLVGIVAPALLPGFFELPLVLFALCALAIPIARQHPLLRGHWPRALALAAALATFGTVYYGYAYWHFLQNDSIVMRRNFYGAFVIRQQGEGDKQERRLLHGIILHGHQRLHGPDRLVPNAYFSRTSGIGLAILHQQAKGPVRIGVAGLGVGTLAAYGRAGDTLRFYEIDPEIVDAARDYFSFLRSCPAKVEYLVGDARLTLERELREVHPQAYDLLALDAFSGDAIPVHLVTRQAVELYLRHLAPEGILAFNVSNRFLNMPPMLANIAAALGLSARLVLDPPDTTGMIHQSNWVLMARADRVWGDGEIARRGLVLHPNPGVSLWTDQFSNLLELTQVRPRAALRALLDALH